MLGSRWEEPARAVGEELTVHRTILLPAVVAGLCTTPVAAADRARVAIACKAAAEALAYDCTFTLTNARTGAPIDNAELSIGADMPSMPMAHNVRPVAAKATATPGEYAARLTLEMQGDWALRLKVAGPLEDQVVEVIRFTNEGAGPPARKSGGSGGGHKH
jgi:YtkA-like protein